MDREITTIVPDLHFSECPRWHDGRLWFSDFYQHRVLSVLADGSDLRTEAEVPGQPSGLGWMPDGTLLIVSMTDRKLLQRADDGTLSVHADLAPFVSGHPNDMVVDESGRAYLGNFGFDLMAGESPAPANLVRVDPDGTASVAAAGLLFPNGSVITDDGELIVNETLGNRVSVFTIADDGSLGERRDWATFGEQPPVGADVDTVLGSLAVGPDGGCLDADGAMWIADALGSHVIRVLGGEIVDEITTPMPAYACMLGGDDGRTLFICTAPDFFEHARREAREGAIVATTVDVPHAGRP
ncbi:SMP-30/gluconolactonase/LRE family protein [Desertimonas flava]|jgi:sugar lactone lactonase YvrE|uniref:SMP-30/gluconolactonase/LRE family protein n=1 Tax=Desertimonas flava TaxID=2064846 RepID=UPI000E34DFB6|nr:SMP-30/gluconolactonase/LRE family protein [Desertimonas flava]